MLYLSRDTAAITANGDGTFTVTYPGPGVFAFDCVVEDNDGATGRGPTDDIDVLQRKYHYDLKSAQT